LLLLLLLLLLRGAWIMCDRVCAAAAGDAVSVAAASLPPLWMLLLLRAWVVWMC